MSDRFELSYAYARICGSLAGAFLGEKAEALSRSGRVTDMWRIIFRDSPPSLPQAALIAAAEQRAVKEALGGFRRLAESLRSHEAFFDALRRKSECARIKRILIAVREGSIDPLSIPPDDDPSLLPGFSAAGFPVLEDMFRNGRYSWIGKDALSDLPAAENRLDRQFYAELWESLDTVPRGRLGALRSLVGMEAELENVVWALRLRRYYGMSAERIETQLISIRGIDVKKSVMKCLGFGIDRRSDWTGWKWESLLEEDGRTPSWVLDVRSVEAGARSRLYHDVRRALHMHPFTYTPMYCYFKIKEYETAALLGTLEGVHLGAPPEEMSAFVLGLTGGRL
jgi:hypothetical protein